MGLMYRIAQYCSATQLLPKPTNLPELQDRIEKLQEQKVQLEKLVISPQEVRSRATGEMNPTVRYDGNPAHSFHIRYDAQFSNGTSLSVTEFYTHWQDCLVPEAGIDNQTEGSRKGRKMVYGEAARIAKLLSEEYYPVVLERKRSVSDKLVRTTENFLDTGWEDESMSRD
ncbi:hypothetical protein ACFLZX_01355 [Nanoarchaeota archaeon]